MIRWATKRGVAFAAEMGAGRISLEELHPEANHRLLQFFHRRTRLPRKLLLRALVHSTAST